MPHCRSAEKSRLVSQSVSHSLQSQHDPRTRPPLGTDTPTYVGGQWRGASFLAARMRGLWLPVPSVAHIHTRPVSVYPATAPHK